MYTLPVGCERWHLERVCDIYTGLLLPGLWASHPNRTEPDWVKKGHVLLSSSSVWCLIERRCSGHWFKNKFDLQNHCLGELKLVLLIKSLSHSSPTPSSPPSHPHFFPSLQEGGVQNHQTKPERVPIHIPTFFRPEHWIVQAVHNILKIFTQGRAHFSNFHKGKWLVLALFESDSRVHGDQTPHQDSPVHKL